MNGSFAKDSHICMLAIGDRKDHLHCIYVQYVCILWATSFVNHDIVWVCIFYIYAQLIRGICTRTESISRGPGYICYSLINSIQRAICQLRCHRLDSATCVTRDGSGGKPPRDSFDPTSAGYSGEPAANLLLHLWHKHLGRTWGCTLTAMVHNVKSTSDSSSHFYLNRGETHLWFWQILPHLNRPIQK